MLTEIQIVSFRSKKKMHLRLLEEPITRTLPGLVFTFFIVTKKIVANIRLVNFCN